MKRISYGVVASTLLLACTSSQPNDTDAVASQSEALDVTRTGSLTRKQGALVNGPGTELTREADTQAYYNTVKVDSANHTIDGPNGVLKTLTAFRNKYFASGEVSATYYNRGDLGIGREMHCSNGLTAVGGQIACYVRNFAAGDDDTEFLFGLSNSVAFQNIAQNHPFATVAMVYRNDSASAANRVFFVVYGANEQLQNAAALDRTGFLFAKGLNTASVPGQNFNNHIPSNCVSCHGGKAYDANAKAETGALFLPFDLDQFDYSTTAGLTRADQSFQFKRLNEMVWKVAALSGSDISGASTPVRSQLNGWYNNTVFASSPLNEVFENDFDAGYVPPGWRSVQGTAVYQQVVRASCRNCHVTMMTVPFETEAQFAGFANKAAGDICDYEMPHSLQSVRNFWQSTASTDLLRYLSATGQADAASILGGCGHGDVATLDPPALITTLPKL